MGSMIAEHNDVDKVAFTGSTGIGALLRRNTAGTGKKISLELGGKSPVVVFDTADLDAVVEGLVNVRMVQSRSSMQCWLPPFGPRTHLRQARKEGERKDEDPPAWALP